MSKFLGAKEKGRNRLNNKRPFLKRRKNLKNQTMRLISETWCTIKSLLGFSLPKHRRK